MTDDTRAWISRCLVQQEQKTMHNALRRSTRVVDDPRIQKLTSALLYAKAKLQLYREAHTGEYVGGVEYTELMRIIDESLSENLKDE